MKKTLISIVTPVFNSGDFIELTIQSVLNQTYKNWELILIDDGSSDRSREIIQSIIRESQNDKIIFIEHPKNLGVAEARNSGTKIAKGDYIAFLDSDDLWDSDKLESQLTFMIEKSCLLSHTAYRKINETGEVIVDLVPVSESVTYNKLLKHNEIGLSTSMYNAKILGKRYFGKIGWEDFSLWLSILKDTNISLGIPRSLVSYRVHQNSSSYNKLKSASKTWKVYRDVERFSFLKSIFYFSFYAVNASIKYLKK